MNSVNILTGYSICCYICIIICSVHYLILLMPSHTHTHMNTYTHTHEHTHTHTNTHTLQLHTSTHTHTQTHTHALIHIYTHTHTYTRTHTHTYTHKHKCPPVSCHGGRNRPSKQCLPLPPNPHVLPYHSRGGHVFHHRTGVCLFSSPCQHESHVPGSLATHSCLWQLGGYHCGRVKCLC